jgi:hypothetical protein
VLTLHKRNTTMSAPDDSASSDVTAADEAFTQAASFSKRVSDAEEIKCVLWCTANLVSQTWV